MARKVNDTQLLQLLSPKRKTITKRMLRSPVISLSAKKEKALNIENVKYKPVHILPFKEITNTGVTDNQKVCADHWNFKILMPIKVKLRVRLLQLFFFFRLYKHNPAQMEQRSQFHIQVEREPSLLGISFTRHCARLFASLRMWNRQSSVYW